MSGTSERMKGSERCWSSSHSDTQRPDSRKPASSDSEPQHSALMLNSHLTWISPRRGRCSNQLNYASQMPLIFTSKTMKASGDFSCGRKIKSELACNEKPHRAMLLSDYKVTASEARRWLLWELITRSRWKRETTVPTLSRLHCEQGSSQPETAIQKQHPALSCCPPPSRFIDPKLPCVPYWSENE